MIRTDREIRIGLERGSIVINPIPHATAYSSTSVDLTFDSKLTIFKDPTPGVSRTIAPSANGYDHEEALAELTYPATIDQAGGYALPPRKLVLGSAVGSG